jgi:hypothetical protein
MGTEIKVWSLTDGQLTEIKEDDLAATYREEDLEDWIEKDTSLLGSKLLVIARQHDIPGVGCLDLLCIDATGTLVVVEFKRDSSSRDTIAQILDYASWLNSASEEEVEACAMHYLGKPLADAFTEYFEDDLQSLTPQNHRLLVVAPKLDRSAERIINYLADKDVKINAVFFRYAKVFQGSEILVRTVLVPETERFRNPRSEMTRELLTKANDTRTAKLVDACRKMSSITEEIAAETYDGSFRYWLNGKMVFGVNVAGGRRKAPQGELDVWIPVTTLAKFSTVSEQELRSVLKSDFQASESGVTDCIVRLKSQEQAQELVSRLRKWLGTREPAPSLEAEVVNLHSKS